MIKQISSHIDKLQVIGVKRIGVFGSVARESDRDDSDVDILVEFAPGMDRFTNFNTVCDILDEALGEGYDLVTMGGLSPYLGPKILEDTEYVEAAS